MPDRDDPLAPQSGGLGSQQFQQQQQQPLLIGHRGVGTCAEQELLRKRRADAAKNGGPPAPERIRENTLRSMLATHSAGGHFVEFDVQLSRDRVPIIHHNFYTDDGRFVGNLTLAELQALNDSGGADTESSESLKFGPDERQYPTLESFFARLPEELGFDVEIKYPRRYLDGASMCPEFHWSPEDYVSTIVDAVKAFAGSRRRLFYSCFVSDVCLLLKRLHPECPVVYLVNQQEAHKYTETRGRSARSGVEFAADAGLLGVAVRSDEFLGDAAATSGRELVAECRRRGLRCLTWGPANNAAGHRRLQADWGVDGVIFDNIHDADDQVEKGG